jgi:hypothetical protein
VLSDRTRRSIRLHKRAFGAGPNGQKGRETASKGQDFKPFPAAPTPIATAACDYTK